MTYSALLQSLLNSSDMDSALMEYDTAYGTILLALWEELQTTYDMED